MKETYTVAEACTVLGISPRTLHNWLKKAQITPEKGEADNREKVLSAEHITRLARIHKVTIARDIHTPTTNTRAIQQLKKQVEDLEKKVETLERKVEQLSSAAQPPVRTVRPPRVPYTVKSIEQQQIVPTEHNTPPRSLQTQSGLPDGYVSFAEFFAAHGIPESTARRGMASGKVQVIRGKWNKDGFQIVLALDPAGQAQFYQMYKDNQHFTACDACPHATP